MTKFNKNMEEIFDVVPVTKEPPKTQQVATIEQNDVELNNTISEDLITDYNTVRDNYEEIIEQGKGAIETILEIAKDSQHPRAFEVAATLIKNVTEANEKLILLQKQVRDMIKPAAAPSGDTNIDKAIFVGSTTELLKALKPRDNG